MGLLVDSFQQQYNSGMESPIRAKGGQTSTGNGDAMVTSGILSGLATIGTSFINASRVKSLAKFNAGMAEIEGRMAKVNARLQIARLRDRSDQLFAKQRAIYAKAGVRLTGSPAEVMLHSLKEAEMDMIITDINAEAAVWQKKMEGDIYKMQASGAYGDALMNSGAAVLNAASKAAAQGG